MRHNYHKMVGKATDGNLILSVFAVGINWPVFLLTCSTGVFYDEFDQKLAALLIKPWVTSPLVRPP